MKSLFEDVSREELIERCENMSSFMCFSINMISDFSNLVIKSLEGHDWYELTEEQRDLVNYLSAKGVLMIEKKGISRRAKCIIKRVVDHSLIDELNKFTDKVKERRDEEKGEICNIDSKTALNFLVPRHYSGRKPHIIEAWGWYDCKCEKDENGIYYLPDISHLKAVCTIGKPASNSLCIGICGLENSKYVYELNRLCRVDNWYEPLSQFIGKILRNCKLKNRIIISFSDTDMCHNGYIYQACNFIYTGITKERTDKYTEGNRHCRHYDNEKQGEFRKVRTAKHRYVYFCTTNKHLKKRWMDALNYPIQPYPKNENKNYVLGTFQEPKLVRLK